MFSGFFPYMKKNCICQNYFSLGTLHNMYLPPESHVEIKKVHLMMACNCDAFHAVLLMSFPIRDAASAAFILGGKTK